MAQLAKELSLLNIFCLATGAMISSGLFILPGLAYAQAGPAVLLSYIIAGVFCLPTLFSMAELTTAMPKAGGGYFYIRKGFGPLLGTMAGFANWFSLSFKGAFALIGMGAYLSVVLHLPISLIAFVSAIFFVVINIVGTKKAGQLQVVMVFSLLALLVVYIVMGLSHVDTANFLPFAPHGYTAVLETASFVFISYGGLIKVAALAEEAKNPERNLPLGMMLSIVVTSCFYAATIYVTVGVLPGAKLSGTLTPISDGARGFGGPVLEALIGVGAFLAFVSTANSGIMTASRYPLGMSRDRLLPPIFERVSKRFGTPYVSILVTGAFMVAVILLFEVELLVKVASCILILLYVVSNFTVIVFRESKIASYKPKFISPFYPYMQMVGIISGILFLIELGSLLVFMTIVFLILCYLWYKYFVPKSVSEDSALLSLLEKMVAKDRAFASDDILEELPTYVVGQVVQDDFYQHISSGLVLDIASPQTAVALFADLADLLSVKLGAPAAEILQKFVDREQESDTVIRTGLAIPHIIVAGTDIFELGVVRARSGVIFSGDKLAHIIFVLVSSKNMRNQHLRALAAIAQITQNENFDANFAAAVGQDALLNVVLSARRRGDR